MSRDSEGGGVLIPGVNHLKQGTVHKRAGECRHGGAGGDMRGRGMVMRPAMVNGLEAVVMTERMDRIRIEHIRGAAQV